MADRIRNFATIAYQESMSLNLLQEIDDLHIKAFVSPLHNKDVNPDFSEKKAHYHILFMFPSVKSENQVREIVNKLGCVGVERVHSLKAYARYLCHLDNPEKAQYSPSDVRSFGGADYSSVIVNANEERTNVVIDIITFCRDYDIYSFADLVDYACANQVDWLEYLSGRGSMFVSQYLKSRSWTYEMSYKKRIINEVEKSNE